MFIFYTACIVSLAGLLFFTITFFAISLTLVVLFFIYYTSEGSCTLHKFFISVNLILCVGLSVTSLVPVIQEGRSPALLPNPYCPYTPRIPHLLTPLILHSSTSYFTLYCPSHAYLCHFTPHFISFTYIIPPTLTLLHPIVLTPPTTLLPITPSTL